MGKIEHPLGHTPSATTQLLAFDHAVTIDRVVVREDQTEGQAIQAWEVSLSLSSCLSVSLSLSLSLSSKEKTLLFDVRSIYRCTRR